MRVKKKELRKRLPQLPINYPAPVSVEFDFEAEKARVENLCKRLADNEVEVRDAVLAQLPAYIREVVGQLLPEAPAELPEDAAEDDVAKQMDGVAELSLLFDKLCFGLFYCMWHSDKPLVQLECAHEMAMLVHAAPHAFARDLFVRSMLRTLEREWKKLDKWRMDKYMGWVRKIVFQVFTHLSHIVAPPAPQEKPALVKKSAKKAADTPVAAGKKSKKAAAAAAQAEEDDEAPISMEAVEAMLRAPSVRRFLLAFQRDVIRGEAVGLTMHCADVWSTELLRCKGIPPALFVALCRGGPLATLQRGCYMEKRVMNNFVVPVAAGALEGRGEGFNIAVARALAAIAEDLSVARGTHFSMRPFMQEAQQLMEQYAEDKEQPELFEDVSKRDERNKIMEEVKAAEEVKMRMAQVGIKKRGKVVAGERARRARKDPGRQSVRGKRWKRG